MTLTYAGIPSQITKPNVEVITGNSTKTITGSLYWQLRNRQGYNLYSQPTIFDIQSGQGLNITVPNCNCEGYEPLEYVLSFSPTNNYLNAFVIAKYTDIENLPGLLILNRDEYFETEKSVVNTSQLPINKINGMRVYCDAWGEIREWDNGNWKAVYPQSFKTLVASTKSVNGCDRPLNEFSSLDKKIIITPEYAVDGNYSEGIKFWIRNDTNTNFYAGRSIIVNISSGNNDLTDLFLASGAINLTFLGYVKIEDGTIDTTALNGGQMLSLYQRFTYTNNNEGLLLEKDLPPGYAYYILVELQTNISSLNERIANNTIVEINISISDRIGSYSGIADLLGNFIVNSFDMRRIVPGTGLSAIALSGSGIVNGRSFIGVAERQVLGIESNKSNQLVAINGNGSCFVVSELNNSQVLRAKIGTVNGIGKIINVGVLVLNPTKQIKIVITHPTNIRSDYPDIIAGSDKGKFNATDLWVWVGSNCFKFAVNNTNQTQELIINGSNNQKEPSNTNSELGLFKPIINSFTAINGSSSFTQGNYEIKIAYYYQDTVTAISHLNAIPEITTDLFNYINEVARKEAESVAKKYAIVFG